MNERESCNWFLGLITAALILVAAAALALDSLHQREVDQQWHARIIEANAKKADDLNRYFQGWREHVVLPDGTVEQWTGAKSEVLFIETEARCSFRHDRYWLPCWTIWARTKDSRRYYNLVVRIDVGGNWRFQADERHNDVDLQHVIDKALSSGRTEVVKKVGVPHIDA